MNRDETIAHLKSRGIAFELETHKAVYTIEEMISEGVSSPELIAKNLFVCDDKKRSFYLISVRDDRRVDLKRFSKTYGIKRLRFAPEEKLEEILKLTRGAVTPLGLLADEQKQVTFYIDRYFDGRRIGVHPCDNTATVWLQTEDLVKVIREHGNTIIWIDSFFED